jgi:tRNA(Ile)-lysidine synthase
MPLLPRVRRFAARHDLWQQGTRVLAAVSGGSDSVAMLFLLHELQARGDLELAAVAHVNHQMRSVAGEDEAFCRALATRLGIPFASTSVDVPALARSRKQSLELAARIARHAYLAELRATLGADVVATAHTRDDQAETVLMRLMRGTGSKGLAGILPRRQFRVRPVLCASRAELRDYLHARNEGWRDDETNLDVTNPRNRVRHELLPYLQRHFNPEIQLALARTAETLAAEDAWLDRITAAACLDVIERTPSEFAVQVDRLRLFPEAVQRRILHRALAESLGRAPSHHDVVSLLGRMEHFRGKWVLVNKPAAPFRLELAVPGEVRTGAGWLVQAELFDTPQRCTPRADVAQIDAATVTGTLVVRSRRPGDRLRPVGLGGTKKLQDVLVDRKVSRHDRANVPIVTDATERIIWVAGHVLGEEFRVTERTKAVIILNLRRI